MLRSPTRSQCSQKSDEELSITFTNTWFFLSTILEEDGLKIKEASPPTKFSSREIALARELAEQIKDFITTGTFVVDEELITAEEPDEEALYEEVYLY